MNSKKLLKRVIAMMMCVMMGISSLGSFAADIKNSHSRGYRQDYVSNYWGDSNMRSWLNSDDISVVWLDGNPPTKDKIWDGYNAYSNEAGFLTNFSQIEKQAIRAVKKKHLLSQFDKDVMGASGYENHIYVEDINRVVQNYDTAYHQYLVDKVFLLDVKQLNKVYKNLGDYWYKAYPTSKAVTNSEYKSSYLSPNKAWYYWLGSPNGDYDNVVRFVVGSGSVGDYDAYHDSYGVRPAFYLNQKSVIFTSGSGSSSNPYKIGKGSGASIKIGDYIEMGRYYDEPILWRCVDIDEHGALILSDKIICIKPFDADGSNTKGIDVNIFDEQGNKIGEYAKLSKGSGEVITSQAPQNNAPQSNATQNNATLNKAKLSIAGKEIVAEAYLIDGSNYFKLRDLAKIFSVEVKQFEVSWDGAKNLIKLTTKSPYTTIGGELKTGNPESAKAENSTSKIEIDGKEVSLNAYLINGNNYFKLRDLCSALGIEVNYDEKTQMITLQ